MRTPRASRPHSPLEKRFGDGCRFLAFPSWHFVVPAVEDLRAERCLFAVPCGHLGRAAGSCAVGCGQEATAGGRRGDVGPWLQGGRLSWPCSGSRWQKQEFC